jgi:hypothetical protein
MDAPLPLSLLPHRRVRGILEGDPLHRVDVLKVGLEAHVLHRIEPAIDEERRDHDLVQAVDYRPVLELAAPAVAMLAQVSQLGDSGRSHAKVGR